MWYHLPASGDAGHVCAGVTIIYRAGCCPAAGSTSITSHYPPVHQHGGDRRAGCLQYRVDVIRNLSVILGLRGPRRLR